ncbi:MULTISPECIES: HDOD domain-containing protein [unclassified Thioalkalivibrio]|uniref:HDOD domain-containing protein n=1 Tax=unclassified Thioalkalivibrio TaxID=2621013 RepID=UPI00037A8C76|nr:MULTISPECIES: HDOD domain-containing protein [unclassified Thioalkalivibrio]
MSLDKDAPYMEEAARLAALEWPILEASDAVFADPDALVNRSLRELARYAERDPGLSLRLVRRANASRRGLRQEVHSVGDAISMLGLENVHREAAEAPRVADVVTRPQAYRELAAQSRLAAMIAGEIAHKRHDTEPGEVALAALLNQLGLLALLAEGEPRLDRLLEMLELSALPDEASYAALGYATDDLSRAMAEQMALPELVQGTLRAVNAVHHRAYEVMVASAVAWQVFRGMDTARGDRDLGLLAGLMGLTDKEAADRVGAVIERFNEDVAVYQRAPLDPQIPGRVWLGERYRPRLALMPRADLLETGLHALEQETNREARIRRMLRVMQFGVGLNRVVFARLSRDGESLRAEHLVGTLHEPEFSHFVINRSALGPLGRVLEEDAAQWWDRRRIHDEMPAAVRRLTGGVDCLVARLCDGDRVLGMVYADRRAHDLDLTPVAFEGFRRVLAAAERPFGSSGEH